MNDNLTEKQKAYIERIEHYTKGLTAVSTGICPGCEKCIDSYGIEIECECGEDDDCELCDGTGKRKPTQEEFEELAQIITMEVPATLPPFKEIVLPSMLTLTILELELEDTA